MTKALVDLSLDKPKLRYIRLERKYASEMEDMYKRSNASYAESGLSLVKPGLKDQNRGNKKIAILTNGYMLGRAHESWLSLIGESYEVSLYDVWKLKPLNQELLKDNLKSYDYIVTIEEQTLDGGFGSIISEFICDNQLPHKLLRLGLPEKFIFENGSRDHLIDTHGLSAEEITNNIKQFVK